MPKYIILLLVFSTSFNLASQTISYTPTLICNLNDTTPESSGLIYVNHTLWTHNDSGGKNELYQIDTITGFILRTVVIKNSSNIDWEDLAQSPTHVFIGDFGNNFGNRTNLRIYKISKLDLLNTSLDSVATDTIKFNYADQTVFTSTLNANNFDCEAFLVYNDSLHLFSKSWVTQNTKHYVLPSVAGNYTASLVESFNIDGLITGADINLSNNKIVLIGYKKVGFNYNCFSWLLYDFTSSHFFSANKKRLELGYATTLGQTEGIVIRNDNTGYFSSEKINTGFSIVPAQLYKFNFDSFFNTVGFNEFTNNDNIIIFPNPISDKLIISATNNLKINFIEIYNSLGSIVYVQKNELNLNLVEVNHYLKSGVYYLKVFLANKMEVQTKKIIIE